MRGSAEAHCGGVDPSDKKRRDKIDAIVRASNTFELVAGEFIEKCEREGRAVVTVGKARWLLSLFDRRLTARPVDQIEPKELLAALKVIEARGHLETARRMRSFAGRIFNYAIATGRRRDANPAGALRGALTAPQATHHAAILDVTKVGALLRAIDSFDGQPMTQLALRLAPHVFLRPGELRQAEWSEIDLPGRIWVISASKMKMRLPHAVPLSTQSVGILTAAKALTGHHRYVFSSLYPGSRPMSENTINAALRRLGCALPVFLHYLVDLRGKNPRRLSEWIGRRVSRFVRQCGADTNDGSQLRVAEAFALVEAAGHLAKRAGALPGSYRTTRAALACYGLHYEHGRPPRSFADRLRALIRDARTVDLSKVEFRKKAAKLIAKARAILHRSPTGEQELLVPARHRKQVFPDLNRLRGDADFRARLRASEGDRNVVDRVVAGKWMSVYCFDISDLEV